MESLEPLCLIRIIGRREMPPWDRLWDAPERHYRSVSIQLWASLRCEWIRSPWEGKDVKEELPGAAGIKYTWTHGAGHQIAVGQGMNLK